MPPPPGQGQPKRPGTRCSPVTGPVDPVHPVLCPLSEPLLDDFTLNPGSWRGLGRERQCLPPTATSKAAARRRPCETNPARSPDPSQPSLLVTNALVWGRGRGLMEAASKQQPGFSENSPGR